MADDAPPEPITLEQALAHLRVDQGVDDDTVSDLIVTAREQVEEFTGLVLTPRTITEAAPALGRWIDLRSWPVTSVDAIRFTPYGGAQTVLSAGAYAFSTVSRPFRIIPTVRGWGVSTGLFSNSIGHLERTLLPVEIDIHAGFATPDDVPATVKHAIKLLIGHYYTNREVVIADSRAAAIELPWAVKSLLRRARRAVL